MLERFQSWRRTRRRRAAAIERALDHFRRTRGIDPMGGHVLQLGPHETVVRVMYYNHRVPPDRAWFAVSEATDAVRELSYQDVAHLESPWR